MGIYKIVLKSFVMVLACENKLFWNHWGSDLATEIWLPTWCNGHFNFSTRGDDLINYGRNPLSNWG